MRKTKPRAAARRRRVRPGHEVYTVPALKIVSVEWAREYTRPATEIKRVPTKPAPKRRKSDGSGRHARPRYRIGDFTREVHMDLSYFVAEIANTTPAEWKFIHGATLSRSGKKSVAVLERDLPTRAITVDLSYPMDRIARVTVRPYKVGTQAGSRREMTVGYLLWQLSNAYQEIYEDWSRWGIRNHGIEDLRFTGFELDDNIGKVSVCS